MIEKLEHAIVDYKGIGYSVSLDDVLDKLNEVICMVNTLTDVLTSVNLLPIPEEEKK